MNLLNGDLAAEGGKSAAGNTGAALPTLPLAEEGDGFQEENILKKLLGVDHRGRMFGAVGQVRH